MSDELKPCPFCGAAATTVSGSTAQDGFFRLVICPECNISFPDQAAWNRRVPGPETRAMLEWCVHHPGFSAAPIFQAFLAEWLEPAPDPL